MLWRHKTNWLNKQLIGLSSNRKGQQKTMQQTDRPTTKQPSENEGNSHVFNRTQIYKRTNKERVTATVRNVPQTFHFLQFNFHTAEYFPLPSDARGADMRTLGEEASGNAEDFVHGVEISRFNLTFCSKRYFRRIQNN
jgi:hypothetical protein